MLDHAHLHALEVALVDDHADLKRGANGMQAHLVAGGLVHAHDQCCGFRDRRGGPLVSGGETSRCVFVV
jgi:hypothetical protein